MMRRKTQSGSTLTVMKPVAVVLLLVGLFSVVWLRAQSVTLAYEIHALEEAKKDSLKDMKLLLAERAEWMSLEKLGVAYQGETDDGDSLRFEKSYVFPARTKVIYVRGDDRPEPYKASLVVKNN